MFGRLLEKPFLTVETGEAYQPIRLTFRISDKERLLEALDGLKCLEKNSNDHWSWFWQAEVDEIPFESVDDFQRPLNNPLRLGSLSIREQQLYLNLPSFKRACLAVPFFHRAIDPVIAKVYRADFMNKVYGMDERLPRGVTELFKEEELQTILDQRIDEYQKIQERCEHADTIDEALKILAEYVDRETHKKLPFVERYEFDIKGRSDPDLLFLSFYIFLRSRELVAIRRWFGKADYTLSEVVDETIEQVFGGIGVDLID